MIDVAIVTLSLLLSVLITPKDPKREWTPTFKGSFEQRYAQAVVHYQEKMGLEEDFIVEIRETPRMIDGEPRCAWVDRSREWRVDVVGLSTSKGCQRKWKPEFLALHESCHRRMKHLDVAVEFPHTEVKTCMGWYSEKWRR
jgi:hypothetical protein